MELTTGHVILKHVLPPDMHKHLEKPLDAKGIRRLFDDLAHKHEDSYRDIVSKLTRYGFETSTRLGSSVSLEDLRSPIDKDKRFAEIEKQVAAIYKGQGSKAQKEAKEAAAYVKFLDDMNKEVLDAGLKSNKTLAKIILSGSRGSPTQYRQTVAAPGIVPGPDGKPLLTFPIKRSFAEGLSPAEYLAHSFGTRTGLAGTKLCKFAETEVRMADGSVKQIQHIKKGEWVLGADVHGNTFAVEVTNVFDNGLRDVYDYRFYTGNTTNDYLSVKATEDHKVLACTYAYGKVSEAHRMPLGDMLYSKHKKAYVMTAGSYTPPSATHEPYALLIGLLIGDGCTTYTSKGYVATPQLSCADESLIEEITPYLRELGLTITKQGGYSWSIASTESCGKRLVDGVPCTAQPLKLKLQELGLAGKNSNTKTLSPIIHNWDNATLSKLLGGIYSADANFYLNKNGKAEARLQLANETLIRQVKEILQYRFGIHTGPVGVVPKEQKQFAKNDQFKITICNQESLRKLHNVLYLVGKKKEEFDALISNLPKSNRAKFRVIYRNKTYLGKLPTFDLEVNHPDHLYVLANGIITSNSVADAGALSKTIFRAAMTIKVEEHDCGTHKGISVSTDNKDYVGSFLAHPVGEFKYNNEVTPFMLQKLKNDGVGEIVVRSPITCEANKNHHHGAVCQLCVGRRDKKHLPPIGDYIGVTAGTTLGEKMSQMTLGSKHTGSTVKKQQLSGFKLVNQLFNIPGTFRDKAPLAEHDGVVSKILAPAQGGYEVYIKHDGKETKHYVPNDFELKVKTGQKVEAGDVLSAGLINPADVVRLKGIGEGRRYAAKALKDAFDDSGLTINHRNFDILTRNSIDHVRITDPEGLGHYLPNQIVSYNNLEKDYRPRPDSRQVRVGDAKGMYLESPVLHYTIGTRITDSMITEMRRHKIDTVTTHIKPPAFQPEMQRLLDVPAHEEDWMHQLYSTYIQKRFVDAVNRGMTSNLHGPSPIPGLAAGTIGLKKKAEYIDFDDLRKEVERGVKVAAQLYNDAWYDLSDAQNGRVMVSNSKGYCSCKTWEGLRGVYKGAAVIEKEAGSSERGCLMAMIAPKEDKEFLEFQSKHIPKKHLAEDGYAHKIHVTVLYGFTDKLDVKKLAEFVEEKKPFTVTLGKISRFECHDKGYDVIKVDVISPDLVELNTALRKEFKDVVEVDYPVYHPHLTLAYVKPGALKHLDGDKTFEGRSFTFDSLLYSSAGETDRKKMPLKSPEKQAEELMYFVD